jgi:hypothetical protein
MIALLLSVLLDLAGGAAAVASRDGLALSMRLRAGPVRDGQRVTAVAELKNVGPRPMRIVWAPSGDQPLSLFVDGEEHKLPPVPATAATIGWIELAPGGSTSDSLEVVLAPGPHQLRWQYAVERGPYGRPLERCWTGRLSTPAAVTIPIH